MSMLSDAVEWLSGQLRDSAGVTVSIRRGSTTTSGVTAVMDNANYEVQGDAGTITRVRLRDWWIAKADYKISAVVVEPRAGDRLIDSAGEEWELQPIMGTKMGDRDAYEDWNSTDWWLHTKRVKT
jgi:hypothetical protein